MPKTKLYSKDFETRFCRGILDFKDSVDQILDDYKPKMLT